MKTYRLTLKFNKRAKVTAEIEAENERQVKEWMRQHDFWRRNIERTTVCEMIRKVK